MKTIPVVYEDPWLLVVDKPSGLLTIPAPQKETHTLTQILNEELRQKGVSYRLHPCHRLDRDTSGLIIYAKGKSIQKQIMAAFKNQKIKKKYIAFVQGQLKNSAGEIDKKIDGLSALTRYRILERRRDFNIVEVIPFTGRKNQIRIHFKSIGHPIVGEDKFAYRRDFKLRFKRLCLHAKSLEFVHPITKKNIKIEIELPRDLKDFIGRYRH
ncbi:MAG: RluA family pseudouridine synthase [Candidatus Omnitrophica bacterium]|nr:RluA family pseudouridine synthase [Candidatus Omnitrophota bacterium]